MMDFNNHNRVYQVNCKHCIRNTERKFINKIKEHERSHILKTTNYHLENNAMITEIKKKHNKQVPYNEYRKTK